jgi:hypothetical protein
MERQNAQHKLYRNFRDAKDRIFERDECAQLEEARYLRGRNQRAGHDANEAKGGSASEFPPGVG